MAEMPKIEKGIKKLVDLLNKIDYIKTTSSCEGHFEEYGKPDRNAHVMFNVKDEKKLEEEFIPKILQETSEHFTEGAVCIYCRYYPLKNEKGYGYNWSIEIESPWMYNSIEKRIMTKKMIERLEHIIENIIR